MPTSLDKKLILNCAPFAWLHEVSSAGIVTELWRFDNLQTVDLSMINPSTSDSATEYVEVPRGDGAKIKYPKFVLELDGTTEDDITPTAQSSDASGKGTVKLVINEAPNEESQMTSFLKNLRDKIKANTLFLVTVATGFTWKGRNDPNNPPQVDGWARMLCKVSSNIDLGTSESPSSITLELVSYKNPTGAAAISVDELNLNMSYTGIVWKGKATTFTPPKLTVPETTTIFAGEVELTVLSFIS